MMDASFQVVFDGQLVEGADSDRVKANVAKVFKTEVSKVEPLFSGRRAVIKRGLDEATARKYQAVLRQAGAVVSVVDAASQEDGQAPAAPPPPGRVEPAAPEPAEAANRSPTRTEVAQAGRAPPPLAARGVPSAPEDMSMADVGALLVDGPSAVDAPAIDTSHLSLSPPGADLGEHVEVAAPEYDLSSLELAPPDTR